MPLRACHRDHMTINSSLNIGLTDCFNQAFGHLNEGGVVDNSFGCLLFLEPNLEVAHVEIVSVLSHP